MEKKSSGYIIFVKLVFVLLLYCVECHGATIKRIPAAPPASERSPEFRGKLQRVMLSILLGSITGLVCALVCACLVRCVFIYMKRVPILKGPVVFSPEISPKTLQSALANENESQVLGSSPNGKYYMTVLDNGFRIAVKKVEPFVIGSGSPEAHRRIQRELEILANLRHRHLMMLRAYLCESVRFCLIYDYIPTGSLEDAMKRARENELQLGWDARLRIAVGIIKGLQYLHFTCTPRILHYNLKPSNVMLDADFEPRLGDCGLARIMHTFDGRSSAYNAPESWPNFSIYTEKSDIFSFGVILGILLTGKDPSDPLFGEAATSTGSGDMGMWFRQLLENGDDAREALDKSLLGEEMEEDEMLMAVRIAAVCLSDMPADRPSSDELVPMLTQLHSF
ncbi:inactive leucine-rich repeat receptor-like protein kinase CORYNE [Lactuca sativa]|uniref:Protein kinase domain-containing protein n=1 Tax=Lactuca sativa TaxID=4236 RepID=A0A9R1VVY2_LACSA|nr:inactive leucine-rich repeat receptor-like protein kinase CORYNE [Lactuca sativa]KAJ0213560.1 hypothetical protein LSAT_V11C400157160 [Lactuca sativa]